jgi:ketosteroid isomerase-like protein
MAHPNEDLLRRGYEAFAAGDINTVLAIFSDDIAWHVGDLTRPQGITVATRRSWASSAS